MTWRDGLLLLAFGFILRSAIDVFLEWRANRPRPFVGPRNYYDPCGPQCKAKRMSRIGWRERSEAAVVRISARVHAAVSRNGSMDV